MSALYLGYDVGSSSIKASLIDYATGELVASATSPEKELEFIAHETGWAEQHPATWWEHVVKATQKMKAQGNFDVRAINAIGISYQMHGLVIVDKNEQVLRPAIIWCDSRAVDIGKQALLDIGEQRCLEHMLNSPGNFTASKLKWVKDNEPGLYKQIYKIMLPGDWVAMKMTDRIVTTPSGLSEGIMWDFEEGRRADIVLDNYGINPELIPDVVDTFSVQGELTRQAAEELGLVPGIKITYRAGDQPNNALSLRVLEPGEVATTAGTSGVVYGVTDKTKYDPKSRVNTFVHVNRSDTRARYGVLLCLNGCGILNSWLKHNVAKGMDYEEMNAKAAEIPIGSEGLVILPYGNGAERTLENRNIGGIFHGKNYNIHTDDHLYRAAQEGIVFALYYGLKIMQDVGVVTNVVRAGNANMFLSPLFQKAFATVTGATVELYNTDGSIGAARGAMIGSGTGTTETAFLGLNKVETIEPDKASKSAYQAAYQQWERVLRKELAQADEK